MSQEKIINYYAHLLYYDVLLQRILNDIRLNALLIFTGLSPSDVECAQKIFQELIKKGENYGSQKDEEKN